MASKKETAELRPCDTAPAFSLPDASGKQIKLADLRSGFVVLYFYPEDFTEGCVHEACDFRDSHATLHKAGATIVGISPDAAERHTEFAREYHLPFTLLADKGRKVIERYGCWGMKNMFGNEFVGVIRSTFLIDPKGKIVKIWRHVRVPGHVAAVLEALEAAKLQSA